MKIGFFDSGKGGLSLMQTVASYLPHYDYVYYGDTAHLPYGEREESEIYELTKKGIQYLFDQDVLFVIVACNTASTNALRRIQDTLVFQKYTERRVLGVIVPTLEELFRQKLKKPLLIGTSRTVDSRKYNLELENRMIRPIMLSSIATPWLVPLIEAGEYDRAVGTLAPIFDSHAKEGGDGVILGCTHYGLLKSRLGKIYGNRLTFISQHELLSQSVCNYLQKHPEIESKLSTNGTFSIYTTGTS